MFTRPKIEDFIVAALREDARVEPKTYRPPLSSKIFARFRDPIGVWYTISAIPVQEASGRGEIQFTFAIELWYPNSEENHDKADAAVVRLLNAVNAGGRLLEYEQGADTYQTEGQPAKVGQDAAILRQVTIAIYA